MIGVIDYGMGNLYSVGKALERLGCACKISGDPTALSSANGLILPGVGSFKDAMDNLKDTGLSDFLKIEAGHGKPILGICLGMQLLFSESEENGRTKGLDLLPGCCVRFSGTTERGESYKVPHMGWNWLRLKQPDHVLFQHLHGGYVYFAHSYVVRITESADVLADSDYFGKVPAVVGRGHVFGTQFHPEKSSTVGMKILRNYCTFVEGRESHHVYDLSGH